MSRAAARVPAREADDRAPTGLPVFPARAVGLELLGEFADSGLVQEVFLVRRGDGQVIQLTALLYLVLSAVDGHRTVPDVAAVVTARYGRSVSAANVAHLLERRLLPLGLVQRNELDESTAALLPRASHLLVLTGRRTLLPAPTVFTVAGVFAPLFHRAVVGCVVLALVVADGWLLATTDVTASVATVLSTPALLLAVLVVAAVSFVFHEFGHAAACRYSGARPGVIGIGVYLVWPALYTDVTDAYRLSRAGRLRTDLGGVYFNAVFALGVVAVWALTGAELLVVAVVVIHLEALQQLVPIVRLDGYYILSDLAGVPDLFNRMRPVTMDAATRLRSRCAQVVHRYRRPAPAVDSERFAPLALVDPRVSGLPRRARITISTWVLVVGPVLAVNLVLLLVFTPSLVATAVRACVDAGRVALAAFGAGELVTGIAATGSLAVLALPAVAVPVLLVRLGLRGWRAAQATCHGRPLVTAGLTLTVATVAAALATCWVRRGI